MCTEANSEWIIGIGNAHFEVILIRVDLEPCIFGLLYSHVGVALPGSLELI